MKIINNKFIFSILLLSLTFGSCKKDFLENRPTDQVATENVFKTIDGAESAVQGIHRMMYELADDDLFGYPSIALLWDLMGDDMALSGFGAGWFVVNVLLYNRLVEIVPHERMGQFAATYQVLINFSLFLGPLIGTFLIENLNAVVAAICDEHAAAHVDRNPV